MTERGGNLLVSTASKQADGGVAKSGQILRCMANFNLALVFAKSDVADPVQTLDAPMRLPMCHQQSRVGSLARKTGDGVLHLGLLFTVTDANAFPAADLGYARPVEMLGQTRAGL